MGFLSWILFGLIAGALAKFIIPGKDPGGCLATVGIGIVGSVIGGFVGLEARAHYAAVLADWGEYDAAAAMCKASLDLAARMPRHAQQLNAPWTRVLKSLARDLDKAESKAVQPG